MRYLGAWHCSLLNRRVLDLCLLSEASDTGSICKMAVPFGFSAGDFIAALGLVRKVIDSIQQSGKASLKFKYVLLQLRQLEKALVIVEELEVPDELTADREALQHTAASCQITIGDFLEAIVPYQPYFPSEQAQCSDEDASERSISRASKSFRLLASLKRAQWALFKDKDVEEFLSRLRAHTDSITMLLLILKM